MTKKKDCLSSNIQGTLMIQGTTSDAGKSICVAGLCRVFKNRGISVAPFKPQNMALNSTVTIDNGEIGRAQALQAFACGLEPKIDFNPVLLKPSSDMSSQVIIQGHAVSQLEAESFGSIKALAFDKVLESYYRLREEYDVVIIEGAGSPAEINLRANDIANMGFAEAVDCPVLLISDIDRGGVFAHLTGTVNLLTSSEQDRIKGFIINQFRGDLGLLQDGLDWLEDYAKKPLLGVIPYIHQLKLDAEDAISVPIKELSNQQFIKIKVLVLPRISNHTDFEPLQWHKLVDLEFIGEGESLESADLIIIPGSKNVRDDMKYIVKQGWDKQIKKHLRYGGKLLGICGGYQMLGTFLHDPSGIEGKVGSTQGLSLLDFETSYNSSKQLKQVSGIFDIDGQQGKIKAYEIHCGETYGNALSDASVKSFARVIDQQGETYNDGIVSKDGQIIGTYLHGLFELSETLEAIINWGTDELHKLNDFNNNNDWDSIREKEIERLAKVFEEHLDVDKILKLIYQ